MSIASEIERIQQAKASIKKSIEDKGTVVGDITLDQYAGKINEIETGIDTSDATATENDIISGKTAYVNGQKITGTLIITSGGVPQEEYDLVVQERNTLKSQVEKLNLELAVMKPDYNYVINEIDTSFVIAKQISG